MGDGSWQIGVGQAVLVTLARLAPDDAYGLRIAQEIAEMLGRPIQISSIYAALHRMERHGQLESAPAPPRQGTRGARGRRVYRLTDAGQAVVTAAETTVRRLASPAGA